MHAALDQHPQSYPILHAQCDFLLSKGKTQWAQAVAQQAVNSAPSEFVTWAKLTETYIELGQFDSALLTLNSCPMFTFNERDLHRMPTPGRTHLPVKKFIADSNILDEESARDNEVRTFSSPTFFLVGLRADGQADVALLRLPAPGLRGTFAKAYALLTQLVSKIGWDELLKTRSVVFVMEEEYRLHKTTASMDQNGQDDNASTTAMRSPRLDTLREPDTPSDIPTIRISSESTRGQTNGEGVNGHVNANGNRNGTANGGVKGKGREVEVPDLEKPETAKSGENQEGDEDDQEFVSAFSNKRLCERWLGKLEKMRLSFELTCQTTSSCTTHTLIRCDTNIAEYCMRISEYTPSGAPRYPTSRPSTCHIARQAPNGRF